MKFKKIENENVKAAIAGASIALGVTVTTVAVYRLGETRCMTRLIKLVGEDALVELIKNSPPKL